MGMLFPEYDGSRPVVSVMDERLRTTSLCLAVAYGSRHDPAGAGGLAHMLEHLLVSVPVSGGLSLSEYVERAGGQVNADTGLEQMSFYARIHADDADEVADLLCTAVLSPKWGKNDLDREREVVLKELAGAAADPNDAVQDAILGALFPAHPLGRPVGGTQDEVRGLDVTAIQHHHDSEFLPRAMTLVAVGPRALSVDSAVLTKGRDKALRPTDYVQLSPSSMRDPAGWPDEYSWACLGARSPALGHPGCAAYRILAELLGSSPASRLYQTLRSERGLAYAFHAWDRGYTEAGAWRIMVGVDSGNGPAVVEVVRTALASIAEEGPSELDLHSAKRRAEMHLVMDTEDPLQFAQLICDRTRIGTVSWSTEHELLQLRAVSADAVAQAAHDVLAGLVTVVRPEP